MTFLLGNTNRKELKKHLAQANLDLERHAQLSDRIAQLEKQKDEAVEQHRLTTEPIQAKLRAADDEAVARVVDRMPDDPKLQKRRQSLLTDLEAANVALQNAIRDADDRAAPHRKALAGLAGSMFPVEVVRNRLYDAGDVDKRARCEAVKWVAEQLRLLSESAAKHRDRVSEYLEKAKRDNAKGQIELATGRLKQWDVTLQVVNEFRDETRNEATMLREEIISA